MPDSYGAVFSGDGFEGEKSFDTPSETATKPAASTNITAIGR
jgi:hypothetical protein